VSRPRRSPAPPGRVRVTCSGRADPGHGERSIKPLQFNRTADGEPAITWRSKSPVTGYAHADGSATCEFRCGLCPRHAAGRRRPGCGRLVFTVVRTTYRTRRPDQEAAA
jgi:hypothetical protein